MLTCAVIGQAVANEKFVAYAQPLIEGEVKPPVENGLPKYVVLEKSKAEKKLPPRAG